MAKRRRSRSSRSSKPSLPQAARTIGFTEAEEAFFRAGEQSDVMAAVAEASDEAENARQRRPSFWRRLFLLGT